MPLSGQYSFRPVSPRYILYPHDDMTPVLLRYRRFSPKLNDFSIYFLVLFLPSRSTGLVITSVVNPRASSVSKVAFERNSGISGAPDHVLVKGHKDAWTR